MSTDLVSGTGTSLQGLTEEQVDQLLQMDVNQLTLAQRNQYLWWFAKRMGLDPMTKPFDCIPGQNGKLIIYANRTAAEQLRRVHHIKIEIMERGFLLVGNKEAEVFVVRSRAELPDGRVDESLGAVPLRFGADAETMANAVMKAETKAKRRVTLSIMAIGLPDESELATMPGNQLSEPKRIFPQQTQTYPSGLTRVGGEQVNMRTGEIVDAEISQADVAGSEGAEPSGMGGTDSPGSPEPQPAPAMGRKYPPAVAPVGLKK